MCPSSLKFENEAHLGHINLENVAHLARIWSSEAGFVQCSASKGVNSYVGLCFFVATYRDDLISVGGHKKNTDLQKK